MCQSPHGIGTSAHHPINTLFTMNKGEKLSILLDKADALHSRMNRIFQKEGLKDMDLTLLPDADRAQWCELYEQSKKIADEICALINP